MQAIVSCRKLGLSAGKKTKLVKEILDIELCIYYILVYRISGERVGMLTLPPPPVFVGELSRLLRAVLSIFSVLTSQAQGKIL
jgi:hypothetical protein